MATEDEDGGWQRVQRKVAGGNQSHRKSTRKLSSFPNTTFFVSNLPEDCTAELLRSVFMEYGDVIDAYVAVKKDRMGGVFGFVRFPLMKDTKIMEEKLKNVFIGNLKVAVNLARYDRNGENREIHLNKRPHAPVSRMHVNLQSWSNMLYKSGRSFKDAVLNRPDQSGSHEICLKGYKPQPQVLWGNGVLMGRSKDLLSLCNLGMWVSKLKGFTNVRYMGGLYVMISFKSKEDADNVIKESCLWDEWFSKLHAWEGNSIPYERVAWIKVLGVPPQLWDPKIINQIGERVGKLLMKSDASICDGNLSQDCMAVLVSDGKPIQERVTLRWMDKSFVCWIIEDFRPWVPEFVGRDDPGDETTGAVAGIAAQVEGFEETVGPVEKNKEMDAREVQGLHGKDNNNDYVFVLGKNTNNSKRGRLRRKSQRSPGKSFGPDEAQDASPVLLRARKRARSEIDPIQPVLSHPNVWNLHLDLNNKPNSLDQDLPIIQGVSVSQPPDSLVDLETSASMAGGQVSGPSMVDSTFPQPREMPHGDEDSDYLRTSDMQLEDGEFRIPMNQFDLHNEIDATIEIAGKVGINLADHHEAVKLAILGEGDVTGLQ
ncbi:hypothetical protein E3N88_05821 [Mikania micrantha]|uniref:RRM domain-containing protein n=1 Tax=Mikania micrantha TaxID=192012 RepID=A0A5N6PNV3_9ASTR|nr:hypothetical protein E3N88_05821 [Mikania micrantha]